MDYPKIISDAGGNFISQKFKEFCKKKNLKEQTASLSYHHQNNKQWDKCIKFIKWILRKWTDSNNGTYIALPQIGSTPHGQRLPSPAALLFNSAIRDIMLIGNRQPTNTNNNDYHYEILVEI